MHRSNSNANPSIIKKSFETLNDVSEYLQNVWYGDQFEFLYWDTDDMGCKPTKDDFTVENLTAKMANRYTVELYAPYSKYYGLIIDQVILTK